MHRVTYDQAIADYTEAIQLDPKYAAAYSWRGNAYYAQGDLRPSHRRLHRSHPTRPEICRSLLLAGKRLLCTG